MLDIEVGVAPALAGPHDIANQCDAADPGVALRVGEERDVVNGVLEGVVEVVIQPVRPVLLQGDQQAVVGGESLVGIERVFIELRRRPHVRRSRSEPC